MPTRRLERQEIQWSCSHNMCLSICISSTLSQFLRRAYNTGFAEVTGPYVNRGAGYGLEVPSVYIHKKAARDIEESSRQRTTQIFRIYRYSQSAQVQV